METTSPKTSRNIAQEERYLVALVNKQKVAFPAALVQEIFVFRRSQILSLPFYDQSLLLGVVHHQNQIVPLVSGRTIFLENTPTVIQTIVTAVRLNQLAGNLTGVAITVDRMVENLSAKEISEERLFQITDIPQEIWQPQR